MSEKEKKRINVLLVEDNPGDTRLIQEMLSEARKIRFDLKYTDQLSKGLALLAAGGIDLLLLDLGLPDSQGLNTFYKTYAQAQETPIVVLSGLDDEELACRAVREGAQDYLVKGQFDSNLLEHSVRYAIERKRGREALRKSEDKYRNLYESSIDGIAFADMQGNFRDANHAYFDMLGYSLAEMKHLTYQQLTPKKWHKMEEDIVKTQIMVRGYSDEYEKEYIKKDGTVFPVAIRVWGVKDEHGKPAGMWAIIKDISERKQTEEELRKERDFNARIAETSPVGVVTLDRNGRITFANAAAVKIFGLTKTELKKRTCKSPEWKLTDIEGNPFPEEKLPFRRVRETGEIVTDVQYAFELPKGERRLVSVNAAPLFNEKDRLDGVIATVEEITDRKKAEEQIKAALREKEILLQEIHHRVKNNLQVISTLLYLQSGYVKDKEASEMLMESRNRIQSMALIHDKLYQFEDLGRISVTEYVRELVRDLFNTYAVNPDCIQPKITIYDALLNVNTAIPCGLIVNELLSNALKHAFPDGKEGKIGIDLFSDDYNTFVLIVSDNGVGFPKDLNFRNTETLGLQLVITLVDQLDGTIELDRRNGTTFRITFAEKTPKNRGLRPWQNHR